MNNAISNQTGREPAIQRELDILSKVLSEIEENISQLSNRIERVLSPAIPLPSNTNDKLVKERETLPAIGEIINDYRKRAEKIKYALVDFNSRIEV